MMFICVKQHLSNIWSSIHEKIKQHCAWVKKSFVYKKKRVFEKLCTVLRKEETTRQEIVDFPFKMFKMRFLRSWKCLKITWNSPEQPVELTQNLAIVTATPHSWYSNVVTIVAHYYAIIM